MEFRILGPLEVRGERGAVALGGIKPRSLLAMLLLHANEPVSSERLAVALWGEDAPAGAAKTVQVHVSRLRKALDDPEIIATTPAGYCLQLSNGELDADHFERLVDHARGALANGQPEQAGTILREALALWRGPPLADLAFEPFAQPEIARLEEQRLTALEARVEADLAAGRHAALVGELQRLVALHPTRERLAGQLMLALYRCGRQAEALEAYREARARLVTEIGVEPGPELRHLHELVLQQDASLAPPAAPPELPDELDAATETRLVDREAELDWLRDCWQRARDGAGVLVTLTGERGIGKSRLAAELAGEVHRLGAIVSYASGGASADTVLATLTRAREADGPTLLVVDDLDAAGADVRAGLADLARAVADLPLLVVAIGEQPDTPAALGPEASLALEPLDVAAVGLIAAAYVPAATDADPPAEWLLEASGGIPRRVHAAAGQWARREAARRVGAVAGRAAAGRVELRSMEAELAGGVVDLQAARERVALAAEDEAPVMCPFKGLASFEFDDAEYYFGRERLVAELVARLVGAPLLGVVGPSGSGKSSVVRAGLLPALAGGVLPGSDDWRQVLVRPGEHPMDELNRAGADISDEHRLVLAVDQFEETFTACDDEQERTAFIAALVHAARETRGRCIVVIAIRADYYERCATYPDLSSLLAANHVLVTSMRRDELRQAVEHPAHRVGLRVEPELTDALVADVEGEPGALPLLSTALLEIWQQRQGRRLRHAAYEHIGGVRGAVARLAEDAFGRLDAAQQAVAHSTLVRLATEVPGGTVERRRVPLAELETKRRGDVAHVIELFTDRRLLTVSAGSVEVAHEALLREWPRLRGWIEEDREGLRIHRGVTTAAQEWDRLERDEGALFRGTHLTEAIDWRDSQHPTLNELERTFLEASEGCEDRERRARRRRIKIGFAGLLVALAAITAVAIVAIYQGREAERQRDIGASRELAAKSLSLLDADPGLSLGLALWAKDRGDTELAENALRQATYEARGTGVFQLHDGWLNAARASVDGHAVVTAGEDGNVRIWSVDRRRVVSTIKAHRGVVNDASFSPDARRVASAGSTDGRVVITDADGGNRRVVLSLRPPEVVPLTAEFSRDGSRLVVAVTDGTVRIVPVDGHGESVALKGHHRPVLTASFNRDATKVVSASQDDTARIWDLATGKSKPLQTGEVASAVFSPNGQSVATAGTDGVVRIWDVASGRKRESIRLGDQPLLSVRYAPDGRRAVTAGEDGVVRLLDLRGRAPVRELKGHQGRALQAVFIPRNNTVVSTGEDGTLRSWAADQAAALPGDARGVSLSPSGRYVTGGSDAGAVHVWDLVTGKRSALQRHRGPSVAEFSRDGTSIISASWDGKVRISDPDGESMRLVPSDGSPKYAVAFDPRAHRIALGGSNADPRIVIESTDGGGRVTLKGHTEAVYDVEFSPDGSRLVSASADGTARIWDARTGQRVRMLGGHGEAVNYASYSADGERVVTAGSDGTARIWRVNGGDPTILSGHQGAVLSAQFNRSGDRVVTGGQDGTVRVWDAAGGELLSLHRHDGAAWAAAFTPRDRSVVSAGADGIVAVSPCDVCGSLRTVLRIARTRADRGLTELERQRFEPRGD